MTAAQNQQTTLGAWPLPGSRPPLARARDALSSHAAADRIEASGYAATMQARTLDAVMRYPGLSSRELAERADLDRHAVARALPQLWARGAVERVEPDDPERPLTWWPAGAGLERSRAVGSTRHRGSDEAAAIARARAGFRRAGRVPSDEDLAGAAAIELRLGRVYAGTLAARRRSDGRVETFAAGPAEATERRGAR